MLGPVWMPGGSKSVRCFPAKSTRDGPSGADQIDRELGAQLRFDKLRDAAHPAMKQRPLFPDATATHGLVVPQGLRYQAEFITEEEEEALAEALGQLPLRPFEFHGYTGNRRVLSFGLRYDYSRRGVEPAASAPPFLDVLRGRVAEFAVCDPEEIRQIGINEYRPGAGIGWHKDKPEFGDVIGVSLLSDVRVRFRQRSAGGWSRAFQLLAARSAYIMSGEVRENWEHSIAPVASLRYSITFRTLALKAMRPPGAS